MKLIKFQMFMFTYTIYIKYFKKMNYYISFYQKNNQFIKIIIKNIFDILCHKTIKSAQILSLIFMTQNKSVINLRI